MASKAVKRAISNITGMTNSQLWEYAQRRSPSFASHTGKGTYDMFVSKGYEQIQYTGANIINEWLQVMIMPVLQIINISAARDRLGESGFGERYQTPNGGIAQRMAVDSITPMTPSYKGLKNGDSVDPFVVYKPTMNQRFFGQNYDYQAMITIQEFQHKQIFASNYGMSELLAGIFQGLENAYTLQNYLNKLEAINAGINSTEHPLQDSQVVRMASWDSANTSNDQLMNFISAVKNIITNMDTLPQYSAYNAAGFATVQDTSRLKLLVRQGLKTKIQLQLELGAFNPDRLTLPVDIIEVPHFGGLVPFADAAFNTPVYPVYDTLGHELGFSTQQNQIGEENVTYTKDKVFYQDPNSEVIGILADYGWIFESIQNPYTVEPIRNPRGMYNNYFANSPNNAINVDTYYTCVVFAAPKQ